jgi:MOSC domain-containing protein YiiM
VKIVSTNIGRIREVDWNGRKITTGIFKEPVEGPLHLGKSGVNKDEVADQKHHGGSDKACYLYAQDHYAYWQERFPEAVWNWGIFGENLTVSGLDEGKINIGDKYQLGSALVQVSQPRLPCYKLGIRFGTGKVVKQFLESPYPGVYLRVLEEGQVKAGDQMELVERNEDGMTVREVYSLFSANKQNAEMKAMACEQEFLAESIKKDLKK